MHLNLVIVISPFAFQPSIQLLRIEPIFRDLLDSLPRHDCGRSKLQCSIYFKKSDLCVNRGSTINGGTAGEGRFVAFYHLSSSTSPR